MRTVAFLLLLTASVAAQAQTPWGYPAAPVPAQPSAPIYIPWPPGEPADQPPDAAPSYAPPTASDQPDPAPDALARALLAPQDAVRASVHEAPLTWSNRLAAVAQAWADHLLATGRFAHTPGNRYGENLYEITGGMASPQQVVDAWADEARDYDVRDNSCTGVCGHYTQIVWRATRRVGCAVAADARRQVWVCEYDPPGNVVGYRPF